MIPYNVMSEERKKELQIKIAEANKILDGYYVQIKENNKITKDKFLSDISLNKHENYCFILEKDIDKLKFLKSVELEVFCSMSNMFYKIINSKLPNSKFSREDLENECFIASAKALVSYTNNEICFTTYFYPCISRHIQRLISSKKTTAGSLKLKKTYLEIKNNLGENSTFDEIVERMKLSENKKRKLIKELYSDSEISLSGDMFSKYYLDVDGNKSFFSSGTRNGDSFIVRSIKNDEISYGDMKISFENIKLTKLEKEIINGVKKSSKKLGINHFAKNVINPRTGKPYSRMAISLAWKRIKTKMAKLRSAA